MNWRIAILKPAERRVDNFAAIKIVFIGGCKTTGTLIFPLFVAVLGTLQPFPCVPDVIDRALLICSWHQLFRFDLLEPPPFD